MSNEDASDDFKDIKKEIQELELKKSKLLKEKAEKEKAEKEKAEKEKAEKEKAEKEKAEKEKAEKEKAEKQQDSRFQNFLEWVKANKVATSIIIGLLIYSTLINLGVGENQIDSGLQASDTTSTTVPEVEKDLNVVSSLQDVIKAVVRIESLGLVDSEGYQEVGVGSGFFVSSDGYIVTNNHVVAGSQGIEVTTNNSDLPIPASIVATSECNDLAVVKVEGNNFKYLEWYEENISPGLDIYAAGYPLATEEYTLLDGIVSKNVLMEKLVGLQSMKLLNILQTSCLEIQEDL